MGGAKREALRVRTGVIGIRWMLAFVALVGAASYAIAQTGQLGPADFAAIETRFRAARQFEAASEFAKAATEYRTILETYPSAVPRVYHNLGLVSYHQRNYDEAIEAFERGIDLDKSMVGSRLFLGICYLNVEQPVKALPHLEAVHGLQPTFESALYLGEALAANLMHGRAIAALREALPLAGDQTANVLYSIGQTYLRLAERLGNQQTVAHPESKETHLAAAKLFESQQVYQVAAIEYLEAAEMDPFNASIFFPLARMLAILGLNVPSELALQRYWDLLPSVPRVAIDESMLPKEQVAEIGTKVDFEGILRSLPAVNSARLPPLPILGSEINEQLAGRLGQPEADDWRRVVDSIAAGRFKEALASLESRGVPESDWLLDYMTVNVHVWLDDYDSAAVVATKPALANQPLQPVQTLRAEVFRQASIEYFDKLVSDHPASCRARLVKAMNFAAREMAEAEGEFLAAIEACPLDTQIRIELADYYLWNSQYAEARQACLDELEIHPHSSAAKKRLGRIHVQLREADKALPFLRSTIEVDPQDADVRTDLGRAYELLERWEDAVAQYQTALELDPTLNRVHYVLARIYFQLGQAELAQEQFRRFKQNEDQARRTRTERIQRLRKREAAGSDPSLP